VKTQVQATKASVEKSDPAAAGPRRDRLFRRPSHAAFRESPTKRDLAAALLQQDQILDRRLGGLHLGLHVGDIVA